MQPPNIIDEQLKVIDLNLLKPCKDEDLLQEKLKQFRGGEISASELLVCVTNTLYGKIELADFSNQQHLTQAAEQQDNLSEKNKSTVDFASLPNPILTREIPKYLGFRDVAKWRIALGKKIYQENSIDTFFKISAEASHYNLVLKVAELIARKYPGIIIDYNKLCFINNNLYSIKTSDLLSAYEQVESEEIKYIYNLYMFLSEDFVAEWIVKKITQDNIKFYSIESSLFLLNIFSSKKSFISNVFSLLIACFVANKQVDCLELLLKEHPQLKIPIEILSWYVALQMQNLKLEPALNQNLDGRFLFLKSRLKSSDQNFVIRLPDLEARELLIKNIELPYINSIKINTLNLLADDSIQFNKQDILENYLHNIIFKHKYFISTLFELCPNLKIPKNLLMEAINVYITSEDISDNLKYSEFTLLKSRVDLAKGELLKNVAIQISDDVAEKWLNKLKSEKLAIVNILKDNSIQFNKTKVMESILKNIQLSTVIFILTECPDIKISLDLFNSLIMKNMDFLSAIDHTQILFLKSKVNLPIEQIVLKISTKDAVQWIENIIGIPGLNFHLEQAIEEIRNILNDDSIQFDRTNVILHLIRITNFLEIGFFDFEDLSFELDFSTRFQDIAKVLITKQSCCFKTCEALGHFLLKTIEAFESENEFTELYYQLYKLAEEVNLISPNQVVPRA